MDSMELWETTTTFENHIVSTNRKINLSKPNSQHKFSTDISISKVVKGQNLRSASTSSTYLFGEEIPDIIGSKLPLNKRVFGFFIHKHKNDPK